VEISRLGWFGVMIVSVGLSLAACGDDDDTVKSDENAATTEGGSAAKSGNGGGGGKAGATAGSSGSRAGRGGTAGTPSPAGSPAGPGGGLTCEEEPSDKPVTCGGETCVPAVFGMNTCIAACCVAVDGKDQCGSKSTAMGFTTACALPALEDPKCPALPSSQGDMLKGCCNAVEKKCGVVSTLRPGCITDSTYVTYPDPRVDCTPPSPTTGGDKDDDKDDDKDKDAGTPDDKDAG